MGTARQILRVWEAVQVELRGCYSLARLRELLAHAKSSSFTSSFLTIAQAPLLPLASILAMDALPLSPPELPFAQQTCWVTFRLFATGSLVAFTVGRQIHQSAPSLPFSTRQLLIATICPGLTCVVVTCSAASIIGFPLPFAIQLNTGPWCLVFWPLLYYFWKDACKADPAVRAHVLRFFEVFAVQVAILIAYIAYNVAFIRASQDNKTYISFLLPLMKLIFKNWASRAVFYIEDFAPSIIVFNVDAFHAIFVATFMQSSSRETVAFIMVVDVLQSLIALIEIQAVVSHVCHLTAASHRLDNDTVEEMSPAAKLAWTSSPTVAAIPSRRLMIGTRSELGLVAYALELMTANPRIENHPRVRLPRHLRMQAKSQVDVRIHPAWGPLNGRTEGEDRDEFAPREECQVACVASVLKMLHMIEFYVLIEFVEVVVAVTFTLYILALSHMPNRRYYTNVKDASDDTLHASVGNLALYAALELLSFVVFCVIVDRKLQHMSTIQQLVFVLHKHRKTTQTVMMMWMFLIVPINLEHFGNDFTFRFQWLTRPAR